MVHSNFVNPIEQLLDVTWWRPTQEEIVNTKMAFTPRKSRCKSNLSAFIIHSAPKMLTIFPFLNPSSNFDMKELFYAAKAACINLQNGAHT
jgi:hypothetical protein